MEILTFIASIISLIISVFTIQKVYKIYKDIRNDHSPQIRVGGSMTVGGDTIVGNHSKKTTKIR